MNYGVMLTGTEEAKENIELAREYYRKNNGMNDVTIGAMREVLKRDLEILLEELEENPENLSIVDIAEIESYIDFVFKSK